MAKRPAWWNCFEAITTSDLSPRHKFGMLVIGGMAGDENLCFASIPELARRLSLSEGATHRLIRELHEADKPLLERVRAKHAPSELIPRWEPFGLRDELTESSTDENVNRQNSDPQLAHAPVVSSYGTQLNPTTTIVEHRAWEEVGEVLVESGVSTWRDLLSGLKSHPTMTTERALSICRDFQQRRQRLGIDAGKLVCELRNDHPSKPLSDERWGAATVAVAAISDADLKATINRLQRMARQDVDSLAEEFLEGTALAFYRDWGLANSTAAETLARKLRRAGR